MSFCLINNFLDLAFVEVCVDSCWLGSSKRFDELDCVLFFSSDFIFALLWLSFLGNKLGLFDLGKEGFSYLIGTLGMTVYVCSSRGLTAPSPWASSERALVRCLTSIPFESKYDLRLWTSGKEGVIAVVFLIRPLLPKIIRLYSFLRREVGLKRFTFG